MDPYLLVSEMTALDHALALFGLLLFYGSMALLAFIFYLLLEFLTAALAYECRKRRK